MNEAENKFANHLDSLGMLWVYEPKAFSLDIDRPIRKGRVTYTPDFYCHSNDTYYEVSANRQAYHSSMKKIKKVAELYPHIKIKVVKPNGTEYLDKQALKQKRLLENKNAIGLHLKNFPPELHRDLKVLAAKKVLV